MFNSHFINRNRYSLCAYQLLYSPQVVVSKGASIFHKRDAIKDWMLPVST